MGISRDMLSSISNNSLIIKGGDEYRRKLSIQPRVLVKNGIRFRETVTRPSLFLFYPFGHILHWEELMKYRYVSIFVAFSLLLTLFLAVGFLVQAVQASSTLNLCGTGSQKPMG